MRADPAQQDPREKGGMSQRWDVVLSASPAAQQYLEPTGWVGIKTAEPDGETPPNASMFVQREAQHTQRVIQQLLLPRIWGVNEETLAEYSGCSGQKLRLVRDETRGIVWGRLLQGGGWQGGL